MIQRIQSIFLLIATVLISATMIFELGSMNNDGVLYPLFSTGLFSSEEVNVFPTWGVVCIGSLAALLSFITIFVYKKRKLQIKLGYLIILLIAFFYVTFYVYLISMIEKFNTSSEYYNIGWIIGLPAIAAIFVLFGIRLMKADEKLVKSLDRIR